jgi:hypothetical protein
MLTRLRSFLMAGVTAAALCASAQELLYEETFPYTGPPEGVIPVSTVGWANDITNNPNRLFQESGTDGAVFAFQGTMDIPISTAFYTTAALETGAKGPSFPKINPENYFCVILSADIRPGFDADNIEVRFAVQMNGSNWLAAATPLPVPGMHRPFATYSQSFGTIGWRTLTLNGTSVTIGGTASAEGIITGAGLVFTHSIDNGTFDFDNFRIIASRGEVSIARTETPEGAAAAIVSWDALPGVRLQSSPRPHGNWEDVPGTSGNSSVTVPMTGGPMFFRLAKG